MLVERLPVTIELSMAALTMAVLVGVPLGIISGYKHNSAADVATMVGANIGVSMPVFWLGLMLQYLFAVVLRNTFLSLPPSGSMDAGLLPAPFFEIWHLPDWGIFTFISNMNVFNAMLSGNWTAFRSAAGHLILPAIALGTIPMAVIARMTRSSLLDVLSLDYVRTARAKGLPEKRVVIRARPPQRHAAGGHRHRPVARHPARRGHPHRDDLRPLRGGQEPLRRHPVAGLHRGAGLHPGGRGRLRPGEPGDRHPVHLS